MSWQIPTQVEQDIISGKAVYKTFQTGNGGQSILPVPANAYAVIFGYDFSPAGGGFRAFSAVDVPTGSALLNTLNIRWFETQQISFYTGTDFFPFIHHVNVNTMLAPKNVNAVAPDDENVTAYQLIEEIENTPIARQVYITSSNDVTITHGLILTSTRASANSIPVTNRTPVGLTYGGAAAQTINTQTNYGPGATPLQFMQPSPKDYQDFAFGLLPANADNQAFATPDTTNGLQDSTYWLNLFAGAAFRDAAATNYYLCLHYALYNKTIPETRG
jgi:hypothetical protein